MYSIDNRDDLEKFKKLQESKSLLKAGRLKEKLGYQDLHYDMEEIFEPVTENQKQSQNQTKLEPEKQLQALRDCSQTTTLAIGQQTQCLYKQYKTKLEQYKNRVMLWIKSIKEYDKITTVIINLLQILLIPTKLILVS